MNYISNTFIKKVNNDEHRRLLRPNTVRLRKPYLLNPKLLGIIDMSRLSREHLIAIAELVEFFPAFDEYYHDDTAFKSDDGIRRRPSNNDGKRYLWNKAYGTRPDYLPSPDNKTNVATTHSSLPIPCVACKRSDLPERFHSHPSRTVDSEQSRCRSITTEHRKILSKPLAVKFKSVKKSNITDSNRGASSQTEYDKLNSSNIGSAKVTTTAQLKNNSAADKTFKYNGNQQDNKSLYDSSNNNDTTKTAAADKIVQHKSIDCGCEEKLRERLDYASGHAEQLNTSKCLTENSRLTRPRVLCELCGKSFGSSTIEIHKEQCLRSEDRDLSDVENKSRLNDKHGLSSSSTLIDCCRKKFNSKTIHENRCLQIFEVSNRKETGSEMQSDIQGGKDKISEMCEGDLFWTLHQAQLVPCEKCGRTFYPARLDIHVKYCKGRSKNTKKVK